MTTGNFLIVTAFVTPTLRVPAERGKTQTLRRPTACTGPSSGFDVTIS